MKIHTSYRWYPEPSLVEEEKALKQFIGCEDTSFVTLCALRGKKTKVLLTLKIMEVR